MTPFVKLLTKQLGFGQGHRDVSAWRGLSPEMRAIGDALQDAGIADSSQRAKFLYSLDLSFQRIKCNRMSA